MAGIVIIGAGHGGTQLAASLREEGYTGSITLVSEEADLPYHKPPLSKSFMADANAVLQPLRGAGFFKDKDISLSLGVAVTSIDREAKSVCLEDGGTIQYEQLVVATGTSARRLDIPGANLSGVFHLRTAHDARAMRKSLPAEGQVVVIGGGFIGLEAAAMLAARGLDVSVLELGPRVLGRAVSFPVADEIVQILSRQSVRVQCGANLSRLCGTHKVEAVEVNGGDMLTADMVVVGIGALPEVTLALDAGITCENGIVTDGLLTTSDPSVFAIGDCVSYPQAQLDRMSRLESVQNATDQARTLAKTLTGNPTVYESLPWFWSDIGDTKLQIVGLSHDADENIVVRRDNGSLQSVWRLAKNRLVAVETLSSTGEHMLARRLIAEGLTPERADMASGDMTRLKAAYAKMREATV